MMFYFIITHFDTAIGPQVKVVVPEEEHALPMDTIAKFMDLPYEGFFTYNTDELYSANYLAEIKNPYARGHVELLMFSIISLEQEIDPELGNVLLSEFTKKFREIPKVYRAFDRTHFSKQLFEKVLVLTNGFFELIPAKLKETVRIERKEEELAEIIENNPNPILQFSDNYELLYNNSAAKELAEILTHKDKIVFPEKYQKNINHCLKTSKPLSFACKANNKIWLFTITPLPNQKSNELFATPLTDHDLIEGPKHIEECDP